MMKLSALALLFGADAFVPPPRVAVTAPSASKISAATGIADYLSSLDSNPQAQSVNELLTTANFKSSQRWRKRTKQVSVSISPDVPGGTQRSTSIIDCRTELTFHFLQLATLGPASSSFEMIEKLFLAGADVFRLNFSHGEYDQKQELYDIIRAVEAKYDHPIAILGDLQGPKLRVGTFANPDGEMLEKGQIFRFDLDETPGTNKRVMLPHPEIIEASEVGHDLLIDDGKVKVTVVATGPGYLDCEVVVAGKIKDKKVRYIRLELDVQL